MKLKQLTGLAVLFAALPLALPFTAGAQSIVRGGLGGTVTDSSGRSGRRRERYTEKR